VVGYWGQDRVLEALHAIIDDDDDERDGRGVSSGVVLEAIRLAKELLLGYREDLVVDLKTKRDLAAIKADVDQTRRDLDEVDTRRLAAVVVQDGLVGEEVEVVDQGADSGWRLCSSGWRPKPIGMV